MASSFRITWDYRCPFARNAHEHVLAALDAGAGWNVEFVPFSLGQAHVEEGQTPIWERPGDDSGLLALQAGVVVRDRMPEHFRSVHRALFAARHDEGRDLRDRDVVAAAVAAGRADPAEVLAGIDAGWPLEVVRKEHEQAVAEVNVWGVPTFIVGPRAVFVRLMERPGGDADFATGTIQRVIDLIEGFPGLNEFKYTTIPR